MPFPEDLGPEREEKDRFQFLSVLPPGSILQYDVEDNRAFDFAWKLARNGPVVTALVVVHSLDYPFNFDSNISSVQEQFSQFLLADEAEIYGVVCLRRELYGALVCKPKCLSCFDTQGYIGNDGAFPVICEYCNSHEKYQHIRSEVTPGGFLTVTEDYSMLPHQGEIRPNFMEREMAEFKAKDQDGCYVCVAHTELKCSCKMIAYCTKACQKADWKRHRSEHKCFLRTVSSAVSSVSSGVRSVSSS